MKWKTKKEEPKKYKKDDTRHEIRFAWFPKDLKDGHTVWLERYAVTWQLQFSKHRYRKMMDRYVDMGPGLKWFIVKETSL